MFKYTYRKSHRSSAFLYPFPFPCQFFHHLTAPARCHPLWPPCNLVSTYCRNKIHNITLVIFAFSPSHSGWQKIKLIWQDSTKFAEIADKRAVSQPNNMDDVRVRVFCCNRRLGSTPTDAPRASRHELLLCVVVAEERLECKMSIWRVPKVVWFLIRPVLETLNENLVWTTFWSICGEEYVFKKCYCWYMLVYDMAHLKVSKVFLHVFLYHKILFEMFVF